MKTFLLFVCFLVVSFRGFSQNPTVLSSINLGGNGNDEVVKFIKTSDGNIVLIGTTSSNTGNFSTNHGGKDILIRKVSVTGTIIWTKLYGGSADDTGVDIAEESNGDLTFVANTYSNDGDITIPQSYLRPPGFWICRVNSSASTIISQNLNNFSVNFFSGSETAIQAYTKSLLGDDITLSRPSHEGFNPSNQCRYLHRVLINKNETFHCFGAWVGDMSFKQIISLSNGDYVAIGSLSGYTGIDNQPYGSSFNTPNAPNDVFIVRFSSTGGLMWRKYLGGSLNDDGVGVQEINNKLYIVGNVNSSDGTLAYNNGGTDILIAKLDLNGYLISNSIIGTSGYDKINSIRKTANNQLDIAGNKGNDLFYARIDTTLNVIKQYTSNNSNNGFSGKDILEVGTDTYVASDNNTTVGGDIFLLKLGIAAPSIPIGIISPTNYCYGSTISVPFTTTLPSGTTYTVKLKKGTTVYETSTGTTSPISINVPYSNPLIYGTDYFVEISAGTNISSPSNALTVGAIYGASLYDVLGNNYNGSTICNGSSINIVAKGNGYAGVADPNTLTYKWYKDNVLLSSETNSSLLVNSAGSYYAVVSQGSCSYSSNSASVSFSNTIYAYNNYAGDPVACAGTTKKIESTFASNQATYQWYKDNILISGATNKVYNASSSGLYNVQVIDGNCIASSSQTRLSFLNGIPAKLWVYNNDTTICGSNSFSKYLRMDNYDYRSSYHYQWQRNGVDIVNAIQNSYFADQVGKYRLKVTQGNCTSYSNEKEIIQSNTSQKPNITAPYTKICSGSLNLQSNVNGSWFKDGATLNYVNSSYRASSSGVYRQVVSAGTSCQNESNEITLQFGQFDKPQIKYVGSTNICGSSDYVFIYADNLNMSGTINRQWKKNGVNISGEIYNRLLVYTAGTYTLVFTNGACSTESEPIVVTQSVPIMITTNTDNNLFCSNRAVKLSVDGLSYNTTYGNSKSWYKDGILIPNETSNDLYVTAAGVYRASINSNGCVGTSTPYEIKSGPPTGFTSDPIGVVNIGSTASINISNCVGEVKWYDLASGGSSISTANPFITPALTQNTSYWVSCTKEYCESARLQVNVNLCTQMYTLKTGSWNDITVWSCGRVPTSTDTITVKSNHFIAIPASYTANAKSVVFEAIGGKFIYTANTSNLCLSCPATIPTNGLMIHLPFNGNANDASGNNNNGMVAGATLGNDRFGIANKAYRFNDGNRINVTNSASLSLSNAFSISVWVNMQSITGRDGNGDVSITPQQCIFTKSCDYGQIRSSINPQPNGSFILQTYANDGDQATIPFQLNQWKLISLTYDGSTLKQFVDGSLVSTKTTVLNLALSNNYNLVIGNMGCYVYYFNGFIDEFRMYDRGLSNSEVLNIYNAERP